MNTLPTDSTERKNYPLMRGCLNYFPAALAGVARWSKLGNDKHNPGEELHHARGKSMDHGDCILRHLVDLQALLKTYETEMLVSSGKVTAQHVIDEADALAWRALALSQELHERFVGAPLAPGAKLPIEQMVGMAIGEVSRHAGLDLPKGIPDIMGGQSADPSYAPIPAISDAAKLAAYQRRVGMPDYTEKEVEERRVKAMRSRVEGETIPAGPNERG